MSEDRDRIIFLRGEKTILRPMNKETDLKKCLVWMNDQEVIMYLARYLPLTGQQEAEWFDNLQNRKDSVVLAIETLEGEFIGVTGLHGIDWKDGICIAGMFIGEKEYWGKEYGTDAAMTFFEWAFDTLNLRKIVMDVFAFNERSWKHLMKCGAKIEGRQKKHSFKNGKYVDRLLLAIFRNDLKKAKKKMEGGS
ncbi:MAG: GNAT family protein [Patescibacteria group bacterium]